jgi:hypothetical protein
VPSFIPAGAPNLSSLRWSSNGHFLRPSRQLDVELAASEPHIVQRFADIVGFDGCAAISSDACLCDAPHQLPDERGAEALRPLRGLAHDRLAERQAPAIEVLPSSDISEY